MEQNVPSMILSSSIPCIRDHDNRYSTSLGKFFDAMAAINCHATLEGPSDTNLMFAEARPFSVDSPLQTYKPGAYSSLSSRSATIMHALILFYEECMRLAEQESIFADGYGKGYTLVIAPDGNVVFEKCNPK
jgi:hypothetical protein